MGTTKTTEEISLEVLGKTYSEFKNEERFVRHLVATVEDPTMAVIEKEGSPSLAAQWVRASLWSGYGGGFEAAASATCELFYALGRQDELGWIVEQAPGYNSEG